MKFIKVCEKYNVQAFFENFLNKWKDMDQSRSAESGMLHAAPTAGAEGTLIESTVEGEVEAF